MTDWGKRKISVHLRHGQFWGRAEGATSRELAPLEWIARTEKGLRWLKWKRSVTRYNDPDFDAVMGYTDLLAEEFARIEKRDEERKLRNRRKPKKSRGGKSPAARRYGCGLK